MKTAFIMLQCCLFMAGCGVALNIERVNTSRLDQTNKTLVFLKNDAWSKELQKHLRSHGFNIKKFASVKNVEEMRTPGRKEVFKEAEARYGIDYHYALRDYCFGGGGAFNSFTVEVSDLSTNDIVMIVEKGGYSEGCPPANGTLFEDLARTLAEEWHP